ncbi:RNA polymerase sigma-70 factor [Gelidibacter sp. F63206]|uniref:RNA polymerase sigma-70 factor n=1 Tax=Gelidibacter sp. F63206 TaxID=2926425 RepID=UPI001FF18371|nr:RNA polymerase sigma-70 factor [Gelidibacter sp. F63206]MCK0115229.1 RNA polymerase sigma-70 factor [Gelidibacter sp. F63206]
MTETQTTSDKLLLKGLIEGNEKVFLTIFNTYRKEVYAYSLSILKSQTYAEEIVQEVFLKIWIKRKDLDMSLALKPYLIVITKNMCLNFLKKAAYDDKMREEVFYQSQKSFNPIYTGIHEKELDDIQKQALDLLPPRRRLIFEMSRNEGKSYKEISQELGISINTVKSQMNKALEALRVFLLKNSDISFTLLLLAFKWLK